MNIRKASHLACYFILSCTILHAAPLTRQQFHSSILGTEEDTSYGAASFGVSGPSSYYPLTTKPYPDPVLLSVNRNNGTVQAGIELSPTGLIVSDVGEYWVNISATVINQGTDPLLVPIYLAINGQYEETKIGNTGILVPNIMTNVFGNGVITITDIGTTIDIIATNGESPFPHEIEVAAWGISLLKKQYP